MDGWKGNLGGVQKRNIAGVRESRWTQGGGGEEKLGG